MLNKAKHKTRLTQNKKVKHTSNANPKTRKGGEREREREREREKVTKSLGAFFLPHLGGTLPFCKPLIWW